MARISVSTAAFDGHPLPVALAEIARAGVRFVEPAYIEGYVDFDEDAFTARNAGRVSGAMALEGLGVFAVSAHVDAGAPEALDKLRRRLAFARALGTGILITNSAAPVDRDALSRNIEALLPACAEEHVVLALENPGQKSGEGSLIGCAADGAALASAFGSPWLRLNYDIGNVVTYSDEGLRPERDIGAALPHLAHVHVKDPCASPAGWEFRALGEGVVDCHAVAAILAQHAPDVPLGLELPLRLRRPGRGDAVRSAPLPLDAMRDTLRRSINHWEKAMRAARSSGHDSGGASSERRAQ